MGALSTLPRSIVLLRSAKSPRTRPARQGAFAHALAGGRVVKERRNGECHCARSIPHSVECRSTRQHAARTGTADPDADEPLRQDEELVGAAVYLASDAASFVTGETLVVDGGFLASGVNQ